MEFLSVRFILFLMVSLLLYFTIGIKKTFLQNVILLISSLAFYAWTDIRCFVYVLFTCLSVYFGAKYFKNCDQTFSSRRATLEKDERKRLKAEIEHKKNLVLTGILALNLGLMFFLKFGNSGLLVPLGVSYYTFQAIGYLLDIKNKKYEPESSYFKLLLFLSYFPQLIQGPINRYDLMNDQFSSVHTFDWTRTEKGLFRILFGLFKKYAISNLLIGTVNAIFGNITGFTAGSVILFGILVYSAQQYCDFSGGIDIVLGVSELYNIELAENFRRPYFSVSLAEFWRRWHISLGRWMRDYVFYPLALSKPMQKITKYYSKNQQKHLSRTIPAGIANIIVFLLIGIWHGPKVHYVLWGLYNGLVIAISDFLKKENTPEPAGFNKILCVLRTFIIVNIGWYFDIIEAPRDIWTAFKNTFSRFHLQEWKAQINSYSILHYRQAYAYAGFCIVILFLISLLDENGYHVFDRIQKLVWWKKTSLFVLGFMIIVFSIQYASGDGGFMYANF